MAIKAINKVPGIGDLDLLGVDNTAFTANSLVYRDTTNGVIKEATSTAGNTLNIFGITNKSQTTTTSTEIRITPLVDGLFVVADCTANTAANQLMKTHTLTDARTINNTSTTSGTTWGVFVALKQVGAAGDKKLMGYFVKVGQTNPA